MERMDRAHDSIGFILQTSANQTGFPYTPTSMAWLTPSSMLNWRKGRLKGLGLLLLSKGKATLTFTRLCLKYLGRCSPLNLNDLLDYLFHNRNIMDTSFLHVPSLLLRLHVIT